MENLSENNIPIKFEIRNNPWKKTKNQIRNILDENKLTCPWNHHKHYYDDIDNKRKFAHIFINQVCINDYVSVYESKTNKILIVKIVSNLKKEISKNLKIIKNKNNLCGNHQIVIADCDDCSNSIFKIINIKHDKYNEFLNENYIFENFYCYYRDIKPIKILNKEDSSQFSNNFRSSIRRRKYNIQI